MNAIEELFFRAGISAKVICGDVNGSGWCAPDGYAKVPRYILEKLAAEPVQGRGENKLVIVRRPGRRPQAAFIARGADDSALLIIIDFAVSNAPKRTTLQALFELTRAEATVAAEMVRGKSVTDIATATRCSVGTVRQHLKSIYNKTCTTRQAELVSVLSKARLLPGIGSGKRVAPCNLHIHRDHSDTA